MTPTSHSLRYRSGRSRSTDGLLSPTMSRTSRTGGRPNRLAVSAGRNQARPPTGRRKLDIFAERALLVFKPLDALDKRFELRARDALDSRHDPPLPLLLPPPTAAAR